MISYEHAMNSPIEVATFWKIQFTHYWLIKQINGPKRPFEVSLENVYLYCCSPWEIDRGQQALFIENKNREKMASVFFCDVQGAVIDGLVMPVPWPNLHLSFTWLRSRDRRQDPRDRER